MTTLTAPHAPSRLALTLRWTALSVTISVLATAAVRAFLRWREQRQPAKVAAHMD